MKRRSFNMESVKELLNSDIYKGIFLLIFLISLIIFNMINKDLAFENAFLYFISYPLYILFMMMILFIASIYTSKILDTKFNIILRYSNKKEYFRSLLVLQYLFIKENKNFINNNNIVICKNEAHNSKLKLAY